MTTAILQTDALPGTGYPNILSFEALDLPSNLLSGLVGLYQFGADLNTSLINLADPTKPLTVVGSPTVNSIGAVCSQPNGFDTGLAEPGDFTYAAVARVMAASAPTGNGAEIIGTLNPANAGASMFVNNSGSPLILSAQSPAAGPVNGTQNNIGLTGAVAGDYNTFIARHALTPIGTQIGWGQSGTLNLVGAGGQTTQGNNALTIKIGCHTKVGSYFNAIDIALAAIWNRAITDSERTSFYTLLRSFFARGAINTL